MAQLEASVWPTWCEKTSQQVGYNHSYKRANSSLPSYNPGYKLDEGWLPGQLLVCVKSKGAKCKERHLLPGGCLQTDRGVPQRFRGAAVPRQRAGAGGGRLFLLFFFSAGRETEGRSRVRIHVQPLLQRWFPIVAFSSPFCRGRNSSGRLLSRG